MLAKENRLTSGSYIRAIMRSGKKVNDRFAVILYRSYHDSEFAAPRLAFISSKKIGKAVVRNRATRLLKESVRALIAEELVPENLEFVVIAKHSINGATCGEVTASLRRTFQHVVNLEER